jgi:hypothetical protein
MEAKFTPAPWGTKPRGRVVAIAGNERGATVWADFDALTPETCLANTHLIAAAPELYNALKACRAELDLLQDGSLRGIPNSVCALIPERIAAADAALAKALGQSTESEGA